MPSTVYTGTASGGHYKPMESPFTLVMGTEWVKKECQSRRKKNVKVEVEARVSKGCVMSTVLFNLVVD